MLCDMLLVGKYLPNTVQQLKYRKFFWVGTYLFYVGGWVYKTYYKGR